MRELEDKITNTKTQTTKPKKAINNINSKENINKEAIKPPDQNTKAKNPPEGHIPWQTVKNKKKMDKKKSAQEIEKTKEQEQGNKPNTEQEQQEQERKVT